ncbi:MAG: BTAD domain-containing putative transcriptional regulator [Jatrophihabitans sp.]|uniref:BTAD domain-containing putative transcriptional regulator n=1 Tax=Jatrophihabitans sp. TaxID=1932789 RepID=UPI00390F7E7E
MSYVLVVDDTPANVRLLEAVLSAHGQQVRSADSGLAALEIVHGSEPPDLVLLDVQMPGMDGYEVCRRLRAEPQTAHIPIVMITASGSAEKIPALDSGADDFIARPFDQAELLARVRSLLRVKAYHDTVVEQAADLAAWNRVLEEQVTEQVEEVRRLQRLRRFLPEQVADVVLNAGDEGLLQPHRGEIAVIFADLRGFTPFASASEPEEVLAALQDFHAVVGTAVSRHAGTVGCYAGDGVMIFFNDPVRCDDPPLRAVSAAVEIRSAMDELGQRWRDRGHSLSVGTGIAYGFATIGVIGYESRCEYTAIGSVVNIASRLCDLAAPGEILLTQRAYTAVTERVIGTSRGQVALRGVEQPVTVWALGEASVVLPAVEAPAADPPTAPEPAAPGLMIRVLGQTDLVVDGVEQPVRSVKLRQLLSLLAAQRDEVVSVARLIDQLWNGEPPDSAVPALRVYVSRLRKLLGAYADAVLLTRPNGYQLRVGSETLDVLRFAALADTGRAALTEGGAEHAATSLRAALELWRGSAYADLPDSPAVGGERARLDEDRLRAHEDFIDAELACGRHREANALLEELVIEYPFRERLWAQRMTALYRSGRQAEALACYQTLRRQLTDELGLDPSPELAALHEAILTRSSALDGRVS